MGNAFGAGWTGISGTRRGRPRQAPKWIDEQVDLTPFAGKEILLRFEMVTDDAVNQPGLLIDNIGIPEIGYQDDGETGAGGWEAVGWMLTDNSLAQRWLVQLLEDRPVGKSRCNGWWSGLMAAASSPCRT